jgi:hypothetical protein
VRGWKISKGRGRRYLELGRQLLEPPGWQLRAPRRELQQPRHLLLREVAYSCPEPADDSSELGRVAVDHVVQFEISNAVLTRPAEQQLEGFQFVLVEDAQKVVGDELVQSLEERLDFVLDARGQAVLGQGVEVLQLGRVPHPDFAPVRDQLDGLQQLPGGVVLLLDEKQFGVNLVDVVLQKVLDFRQVKIGVVLFEVFVVDPQAYNLRQERPSEPGSHQLPVRTPQSALVQTFPHDFSRELVMSQFEMGGTIGIGVHQRLLPLVKTCEEAVLGVKQLRAYQFEPLSPQTTPIDSLLPLKRDLEISAPLAHRKILRCLHARLEQLLAVYFHRELLVVVLLVVLAHLVVEKILFVFERFGPAHIFQKKLSESGSYDVAFSRNQFDSRLTTVVHGEETGRVVHHFRGILALETELKQTNRTANRTPSIVSYLSGGAQSKSVKSFRDKFQN